MPPYPILDPILKAYIEEGKSFEEIIAKRFNSEVVKDVIQTVDRKECKRRQAPPGIKITPRAFGRVEDFQSLIDINNLNKARWKWIDFKKKI